MIEIRNNPDSERNFIVKSNEGKTLLTSISFNDQKAVETAVKELSNTRSTLNKVERKTNFEGKFLFHLKNDAGQLIGHSGLYSSEAGMENGIKNLQNNLSFHK